MRYWVFAFFITATLCYFGESAKILAAFPMPAHSHFTLGFTLMKELAAKGHEVTFLNPYPQKKPIKNLRDVSTDFLIKKVDKLKEKLFEMDNMGFMDSMDFMVDMGKMMVEEVWSHQNFRNLLQEKFDVVIIEHFMNEAYIGLGHHFKAPVILISPMPTSGMNNYMFANPSSALSVPVMFSPFGQDMSFFERMGNVMLEIFSLAINFYKQIPVQNEILQKYIPNAPDLHDVLYNSSFLLVNAHPSISQAVPLAPNVIEIGGYHIAPPEKLPKDLQDFLDNAKEGVVLFSMGSNLKSADLKPDTLKAILGSFGRIKQKVLWKFEKDLPGLPPNVKIQPWLPQKDILAHPNVQAFITHGGLLSTIETIYHGVPIIGIPVFGDQKSNIARAVGAGYALTVPLTEITEESLSAVLSEILNNPKYRENAKFRSKVMHDRPVKPIDTAIYWIEYAIRHRGAPHMKSPALKLKWYQQSMLDIISVLLLAIVTIFTIFYIAIKRLFRLCFSNKITAVSQSKKKQ